MFATSKTRWLACNFALLFYAVNTFSKAREEQPKVSKKKIDNCKVKKFYRQEGSFKLLNLSDVSNMACKKADKNMSYNQQRRHLIAGGEKIYFLIKHVEFIKTRYQRKLFNDKLISDNSIRRFYENFHLCID